MFMVENLENAGNQKKVLLPSFILQILLLTGGKYSKAFLKRVNREIIFYGCTVLPYQNVCHQSPLEI